MKNKFTIDHDLHIHTYLSSCSKDPEQTPAFILEYARENGLKTVCITDHFWDERVECGSASHIYEKQNFPHIQEILPLPEDREVKMLFGCEADLDKNLTLGLSRERMSEFDFIIVATTHMHFHSPEPDNSNPEYRAKLWVERLEAVLNMDLPFERVGIAHLACFLINRSGKEEYRETLRKIPAEDMERLFKKAAALGVGIELNKDDFVYFDYADEEILRIFKVAKACGCKFYLGSDAHHPEEFGNAKRRFEKMIELLELTEEDKFVPQASRQKD